MLRLLAAVLFLTPQEKPAGESPWPLLQGLEKADVTWFKVDPRSAGREVQKEEFHGYAILDRKPFQQGADLLALLKDPKSYRALPSLKFTPAMGFRFKAGADQVDLMVSLNASKVLLRKGDLAQEWSLTEEATDRFMKFDESMKPAGETWAWLQGLEKAEVTFYKVDPKSRGRDEKKDAFHGYAVLDRRPFNQVADLLAILKDPKTFQKLPTSCFDPGMGFRFKAGDVEADLLVCLDCSKIKASKGDLLDSWNLSKEGNERFLKLYESMVPKGDK
jgi:hypothetical protein